MDEEPHSTGETDTRSPAKAQSIKRRHGRCRRFIRSRMRKSHQRKTERERKYAQESPEDRAARKTANATVWIAVFTVVLAVASILTLAEVMIGGSDTHALAVAAGKQADKLSNVSDAADKIRQASENMVAQEQRIADNAQNALDASNRQSKATLSEAETASETQNRPWISLQNLHPTEGHLLPDPSVPVNWYITYDVVNTGYSPAVRIEVWGFVTVGKGINTTFQKDAPCQEADIRSDNPAFPSVTVFRNQPITVRDHVFSFKQGETPTDILGGDSLVACISYKDATNQKRHHTKMLFRLTEGPNWYTIPETGRRVQQVGEFELENAATD